MYISWRRSLVCLQTWCWGLFERAPADEGSGWGRAMFCLMLKTSWVYFGQPLILVCFLLHWIQHVRVFVLAPQSSFEEMARIWSIRLPWDCSCIPSVKHSGWHTLWMTLFYIYVCFSSVCIVSTHFPLLYIHLLSFPHFSHSCLSWNKKRVCFSRYRHGCTVYSIWKPPLPPPPPPSLCLCKSRCSSYVQMALLRIIDFPLC